MCSYMQVYVRNDRLKKHTIKTCPYAHGKALTSRRSGMSKPEPSTEKAWTRVKDSSAWIGAQMPSRQVACFLVVGWNAKNTAEFCKVLHLNFGFNHPPTTMKKGNGTQLICLLYVAT